MGGGCYPLPQPFGCAFFPFLFQPICVSYFAFATAQGQATRLMQIAAAGHSILSQSCLENDVAAQGKAGHRLGDVCMGGVVVNIN